MNKDNICDYTISMFRFYAFKREPDTYEIEKLKESLTVAEIADLTAVCFTLKKLREQNEYSTISAVKEIYFTAEGRKLQKSEISRRVIRFSIENYVSERVVWKMLRNARKICAEFRGLRKE